MPGCQAPPPHESEAMGQWPAAQRPGNGVMRPRAFLVLPHRPTASLPHCLTASLPHCHIASRASVLLHGIRAHRCASPSQPDVGRSPRPASLVGLRPRGVSSSAGGGVPSGDHRRGRASRHANRGGQVLVLPAAGSGARRYDPGAVAIDRPDGGPGRSARSPRSRRRTDPLGPRPRRLAGGVRKVPRWRIGFPLRCAGAARGPRLPGDAGQTAAGPDRGRRGALHFALGARFSPRLSDALGAAAHAAPRPGDRSHRDRHADGAAGHRRTARDPECSPLHSRIQTDQYRGRVGGDGAVVAARCGAEGARRRRPPSGHRLHADAQGSRGARRRTQRGLPGGGLPRRDDGCGPRSRPARLSGGRAGGHRGDHRLRDGDRQTEHPDCDPHRYSGHTRKLLSGNWSRRQGRCAVTGGAVVLVGRSPHTPVLLRSRLSGNRSAGHRLSRPRSTTAIGRRGAEAIRARRRGLHDRAREALDPPRRHRRSGRERDPRPRRLAATLRSPAPSPPGPDRAHDGVRGGPRVPHARPGPALR